MLSHIAPVVVMDPGFATEPVIGPAQAGRTRWSRPGMTSLWLQLLRRLHGSDFVRAGLHRGGDEEIDAHPGALDLRRERIREPALERPDQRFADDLVMAVLHAVAGVARAEFHQLGRERVEV